MVWSKMPTRSLSFFSSATFVIKWATFVVAASLKQKLSSSLNKSNAVVTYSLVSKAPWPEVDSLAMGVCEARRPLSLSA